MSDFMDRLNKGHQEQQQEKQTHEAKVQAWKENAAKTLFNPIVEEIKSLKKEFADHAHLGVRLVNLKAGKNLKGSFEIATKGKENKYYQYFEINTRDNCPDSNPKLLFWDHNGSCTHSPSSYSSLEESKEALHKILVEKGRLALPKKSKATPNK